MGILNLRSWEPASYGAIAYELKRANVEEAKALVRVADQMMDGLTDDAEGDAAKAKAAVKMALSVPEGARDIFCRFVRNVSGVLVDDVPITTGEDLYDKVADPQLVLTVLIGLTSLARLSPGEGKASASPSGSSVGEASQQTSPASDATSTESAAGPASSGATASPALDADFVSAEA